MATDAGIAPAALNRIAGMIATRYSGQPTQRDLDVANVAAAAEREAADARLASAVVIEGQRWQAEVTNLRNALKEAGKEMDRRYEMGAAAERAKWPTFADPVQLRRAANQLAIEDAPIAVTETLFRLADLLDGRTDE